jgi:small nuclear ribonucleoprotein (snRNP)-like protein
MREYIELMKTLLGKRVAVTLTDSNEKPRIIVTGTLIAFDEMGEVVVQDDSGDPHWCWPNLKIEEVADPINFLPGQIKLK